jgi:nucleoside-diphosphate-sugar epimerase
MPGLDLTPLRGASVLVTGGSGFIGGRLAEYLALAAGARVRILTTHFGHAVYAARLPVELLPGDLLDTDSLLRAVAGCEYIFHCAYGSGGDDDERRRVTLDGTANLLHAAHSQKIKRFVHVSTVAVHGPNPGGDFDETYPCAYTGDVYGDAKIDAEKTVFEAGQAHGIPVTVLRPTVVYGPRSKPWTLRPILQLKEGTLRLMHDGRGLANHVYVDDVAQAILCAAILPAAVGEAFIVSHGTTITWAEFYQYYQRMLHQNAIPSLDLVGLEAAVRQRRSLRNPLVMALSYLGSPHARSVLRQFPVLGGVLYGTTRLLPGPARRAGLARAEAIRQIKLAPPPELPSGRTLAFYAARNLSRIDKARRLLGYQPQVSLDRGMALTEDWLRYVRLIPASSSLPGDKQA